jgi:hypothetical protein
MFVQGDFTGCERGDVIPPAVAESVNWQRTQKLAKTLRATHILQRLHRLKREKESTCGMIS